MYKNQNFWERYVTSLETTMAAFSIESIDNRDNGAESFWHWTKINKTSVEFSIQQNYFFKLTVNGHIHINTPESICRRTTRNLCYYRKFYRIWKEIRKPRTSDLWPVLVGGGPTQRPLLVIVDNVSWLKFQSRNLSSITTVAMYWLQRFTRLDLEPWEEP